LKSASVLLVCTSPSGRKGDSSSKWKVPQSNRDVLFLGALTTVTLGTCTINANQAGNTAYLAGPLLTQSFTVNHGTATVTLGDLTQTYAGSPLMATATTAPTGFTVGFTYNGSATPPAAAGSYAVVATVSGTNYTGSATGTLVINNAPQTITFTNPGTVMQGGTVALSASATSGLAVTFASQTP
jgi:hypothetical protein